MKAAQRADRDWMIQVIMFAGACFMITQKRLLPNGRIGFRGWKKAFRKHVNEPEKARGRKTINPPAGTARGDTKEIRRAL